jgi:acyl carrier protein
LDRNEAFSKFQACTVEVLAVPEDKVVVTASFADDLDADSLDLVELVMTVGEAFDMVASKL